MIVEARAGNVPAPRIFTAGVGFSHPEGFPPAKRGPATEEEAREMVRELAAQEVDLIKMWVDTFLDTRPKIEPGIRARDRRRSRQARHPRLGPHLLRGRRLAARRRRGCAPSSTASAMGEVDDDFVAMAQENGLTFAPALGQAKTFWWVAEHPELLDDGEFRAGIQPPLLERLLDPREPCRHAGQREHREAPRRLRLRVEVRSPDERGRCRDHPRLRQRRRQHRVRLGHPPRAGSPGR